MDFRVFRSALLLSVLLLPCLPAQANANIYISPESVYQGRTFTIKTSKGAFTSGQARFMGKNIPFYSGKDGLSTIIGVSASAPTGPQTINISAENIFGETEVYTTEIYVRPYKFLAEKLVFPPQKTGKLTTKKIASDQEELEKVLCNWTQDRLWEGKFIVPVKGRTTSPFGAYRLYNGKHLGDHRGADIGGNPAGTPIKATNSGVVAFAKPLPAYGSVVVIDHGQGIHSIYMHLSKTLVKIGQLVKKGGIIGRVGSTGISTGPHLHWGISIHDTRVDPMAWAKTTTK